MEQEKFAKTIIGQAADVERDQISSNIDGIQCECGKQEKGGEETNARIEVSSKATTIDIYKGARPKHTDKHYAKPNHSEETTGYSLMKDINDKDDILIKDQPIMKKLKQKYFELGTLGFLTNKQKQLKAMKDANKDNVEALVNQDIQITVTNENGEEKDSKPDETSTYKITGYKIFREDSKYGLNPRHSTSSSSSSSDTSSSTWYKLTRSKTNGIYSNTSITTKNSKSQCLSNERNSLDRNNDPSENFKTTEKKENNIFRQQQCYNKKKAKPFQKLSMIKTAIYDVTTDGDQKRCHVKSITMICDQKMVIFDRNNKCIKVFDKDFRPLDRVSIDAKFCSLTTIGDYKIAATFPESKMLQFYTINSMTNKIMHDRTHSIAAEFYSIAHHHSMIFLLQRNRKPGITEHDEWHIMRIDINYSDENMQSLRKICPGHQNCTLFANDEGLYLTNNIENEVLLLDHDGIFKYRHKVIYSLPVGITADKYGNIYVCGGSITSFIEVIKPDLRRSRVIFIKTVSDPVALYFDKQENSLFVCDKILGKILKYTILHNGTIQGALGSFLIDTGPTG